MNSLENNQFIELKRRFVMPAPTHERVKLLKFVCDFGSGGTEGQVFNLVGGLDSTYFEIEFASLNKQGPFVEEYAKQGIAMNEFPITSFCSLKAFLQMMKFTRYLRSYRIEIMHAYNFYSLVFAIPAAKLAGVPVIIASIRDQGVYLTKMQKFVQKLVCNMADQILVNAESIRDWLLEQGYQQNKIIVIKNGIDLTRYESKSNEKHSSSIRSDWSINEDAPLVVMLARLNRQKGVVDFIQASALVHKEHPNARFLIIGKPSIESMETKKENISEYQQWQNLSRDLQLDECLFFCGHRSDVSQILSQTAVSVLPSHSEGISNTLLESMAAGAPVVATTVGGTPELIEDGIDGILVPPHAPEYLSKGICRILADQILAQELSHAAKRKAKDYFSLDAMVSHTRDIYAYHLGSREALS